MQILVKYFQGGGKKANQAFEAMEAIAKRNPMGLVSVKQTPCE